MTPLVRACAVVHRFGQVVALDGVDLEVNEGEAVGLSGSNGSGRTTLLQILATLRTPTTGTVEIAGIDAVKSPSEARALVMYVGHGLAAAGGLRVREYLDFVWSARGSQGRATTAGDALERSELPADARVERLSPGLQRQLALTAALLVSPRALLLDDPLAGLDETARHRYLDWLAEARRTGLTTIAAVNARADVDSLCTRVLRMEGGRIVSRAASSGVAISTREPAFTSGGA